jgi:hypothetical protein
MIFLKKYANNYKSVHRFYMFVYNMEMEYIDDLLKFTKLDYDSKENTLKEIDDILLCTIKSDKIFIKDSFKRIIYEKENIKELFEIIHSNFEHFLNLKNPEFPYRYEIHYTNDWKKKLAQIGLWDKSILSDKND